MKKPAECTPAGFFSRDWRPAFAVVPSCRKCFGRPVGFSHPKRETRRRENGGFRRLHGRLAHAVVPVRTHNIALGPYVAGVGHHLRRVSLYSPNRRTTGVYDGFEQCSDSEGSEDRVVAKQSRPDDLPKDPIVYPAISQRNSLGLVTSSKGSRSEKPSLGNFASEYPSKAKSEILEPSTRRNPAKILAKILARTRRQAAHKRLKHLPRMSALPYVEGRISRRLQSYWLVGSSSAWGLSICSACSPPNSPAHRRHPVSQHLPLQVRTTLATGWGRPCPRSPPSAPIAERHAEGACARFRRLPPQPYRALPSPASGTATASCSALRSRASPFVRDYCAVLS